MQSSKKTKSISKKVKVKPGSKSKKETPAQIAEKEVDLKVSKGKGSRKGRYFYAVGRRKEAVACVKLRVGKGQITVNNKDYPKYFLESRLQKIVCEAQNCVGRPEGFDLEVKVKGGGVKGQSEAVRHGIARALFLFEPNFRKRLKRAGFLKRDPRKKERKKYGLKGARRAPQFSKR